ncbi:aldehyde dehydrogenase family protein [Lysinibacillus odysseyi]|uniref:Salicylaldehyde dehydrogenase n=1 Tax=Lysinibacillus odysseyi 34hs-1 = NBRC 100172 TaxID=1220589 RepID=A0A0A3IVU3_9BACI|nr:aldehyde dehydrogenase family protein [Lysinibacillus odysseyi]KGR87018.1 aldehyde dehydrogenase [Lysinibacillus odysseyi 34hs-1 = NBRC 100172]
MDTSYTKQYINGEWKVGSSEKTIKNINPYTGEEIFTIRSADKSDLDKAYEAAYMTQPEWANKTVAEKQGLFQKLVDVMLEEKETIIEWLIKESGSTHIKAMIEFDAALGIVKESMSFPTRMKGYIFPSIFPNKENRIYRIPKGVVAVIGPWNFPFHLTMRSVAPALATGNTVVVKPASDTPVTSGLIFGSLFEKAGFPKGLVNVLVGKGSEIGDEFVLHPIPKIISFTGSTEVGRRIGERAGKYLKDVALELGGNNVMIVLKDANIEKAAKAAAFGKFLHQGQICMALNRIVVAKEIYEEFIEHFIKIVSKLPYGDPADKSTFVGPVINKEQADRLEEVVKTSIEQGAELIYGGKVEGCLMQPTVLRNVSNDMDIAQKEIFGPIATILKFEDEEEAIEIANGSPYGLSGSIFTEDRHHGVELAMKIETGMIHINDQSVNDEAHIPFGGEKDSGVGRFNGEWAIEKFTTVKWIGVQSGYREFPL